eukprot:TRINITY_DN12582_c1_g1_i1.p3 TRINITY_DN12582_c1_g1~~TRINITY_DN12582_c1_g1_i1.p3  ORF type:complete len:101 (-),score=12.74 TRINITY_DN12582_c1_g1_i1:144-446(-)
MLVRVEPEPGLAMDLASEMVIVTLTLTACSPTRAACASTTKANARLWYNLQGETIYALASVREPHALLSSTFYKGLITACFPATRLSHLPTRMQRTCKGS